MSQKYFTEIRIPLSLSTFLQFFHEQYKISERKTHFLSIFHCVHKISNTGDSIALTLFRIVTSY